MAKRKFTAKKKLNGSQLYRKWSEYSIGDWLIGKYVGIHEDKTYNKEHFKIEVEEAEFKDGTGDDYQGKTLVLNTTGGLEKAMDKAEEGQFFQFEYCGMETMTGGIYAGKDAHSIEVTLVEEEGDDVEEDESNAL